MSRHFNLKGRLSEDHLVCHQLISEVAWLSENESSMLKLCYKGFETKTQNSCLKSGSAIKIHEVALLYCLSHLVWCPRLVYFCNIINAYVRSAQLA